MTLNIPFSYARSSENDVEKMENLHRKVRAKSVWWKRYQPTLVDTLPGSGFEGGAGAVQTLLENATSMLPSLVHSLSLKVEDRDHALERNVEEFEEYVVGYRYHGKSGSLQFAQEAMVVKAVRASQTTNRNII